MYNKKNINKKVIKAISIGLTAAMTFSQPLTVLADEIVPEDANKYEENSNESEIATEVGEACDAVDDAIDAVEDFLGEEQAISGVATELNTDLGEALTSLKNVDVAIAIIEATEDLLPEVEDIDIQDDVDILEYSETKVNEYAAEAILAVEAEEKANESIQVAVDNGNESVEAAVNQYTVGIEAIKEADKAVSDATAQIDVLTNSISEATTVSEATQAYDKIDALIKDTKTTLDEKQAALSAAKDAYAKLIDDISNYEALVDGARDEYASAKDAYDEAAKKYGAWSGNVEIIKKYKEAYDLAKTNLASAENKLGDAEDKADSLEQVISDAEQAASDHYNGAEDIIAKQKTAEKTKKIVWADQDALFDSIMKNYYLPIILGAQKNDENTYYTSYQWSHKKGYAAIDKTAGKDGDYNYCSISYNTGEKEETKYIVYKMERDENNVQSTNRIYIFEKRDNEVKANRALNTNPNSLLYNEGIEVDYYKADNTVITKEDLEAGLENETIILEDGIYYKLSNNKKNKTKIKGVVEQNLNAASRAVLIESTDEGLKDFLDLDKAAKLKGKYEGLNNKAGEVKEKVSDAKDMVDELQEAFNSLKEIKANTNITMEDLPKQVEMNSAKIKSIVESLIEAGVDFKKNPEDVTIEDVKKALDSEQEKLNELKAELNNLEEGMSEIAEQLADTIEKLTSVLEEKEDSVVSGSENGNTVTDSTSDTKPITEIEAIINDNIASEVTSISEATSVVTPITTPEVEATISTPTVVTPISVPTVAPAVDSSIAISENTSIQNGVAGARKSSKVAETPEEKVSIEEGTGAGEAIDKDIEEVGIKEEKVAKEKIDTKKIVEIEDEATPLSDMSQKKMNWWWLLLLAALGLTTEETYRRNKNKKEEAAKLDK